VAAFPSGPWLSYSSVVAAAADIDRLYQLSLDEFTEARNALAKEVAKSSKADADGIRKLAKPPLAAWAINQVYWKARPAYHALAASAAALRGAHGAVMSGKHADLRAAGKAHEDALDAVLKTALALIQQSGGTVTDATKQAIVTTLHGLATSPDPPGRLSRTLQPAGFGALAGLPLGPGTSRGAALPAAPPPAANPKAPGTPKPTHKPTLKKDERHLKAIAKAKEALASVTRTERTAEQAAKRDEFEAARLTRDHERASETLASAKAALDEAQQAHDEAETALETIARKKDSAVRRARESGTALASARVRTESARADLAELEAK